jgi:hypothetical protein
MDIVHLSLKDEVPWLDIPNSRDPISPRDKSEFLSSPAARLSIPNTTREQQPVSNAAILMQSNT